MEEEPGICNGNYVMIKSDKPKESKNVQRSPIKSADSALSRALHKHTFSPQEPQPFVETSPSVSPPSLPQSYLEPASHVTAATSVSSSVERKARFKHHKKPTISDSPRLVELCEEYIATKNIDALAKVARQRGLPPNLRQRAWPLLLADHPYVLQPNIGLPEPKRRRDGRHNNEETTGNETNGHARSECKSENEIPIRRVKGDLSRLQRKLKSQKLNKLELQYKQLQSNPSSHVSQALSARSTPLSISPVSAASEGSLTMDHLNQVVVTESQEARRFDIYEDAIESFLSKYHIKYESGLVWVAAAVAECVDPLECDNWIQVYENFMLVILHTPQRDIGINEIEDRFSGKNYYSDGATSEPFCESPATDDKTSEGTVRPKTATSSSSTNSNTQKIASHILTDSISLFLSGFRRELPELSAHFDEEDVLASIGGGDEWLIWWIKWMGAKSWNSQDRARVWDMYLGWKRISDVECEQNVAEEAASAAETVVRATPDSILPSDSSSTTPAPSSPSSDASESDIGMDPFWSPMKLDRVQEPNLPPRIQHLFICLAMIKAKKNTLLELEQSEIREYLSRLGKSKDIEGIVLEAGEIWRSWQWNELENEE